jgi:putative hydrolase of the HAD superfamily
MPLRVVTFDLDNTLWDVEPALLRAEAVQRAWLLEHRPRALAGVETATLTALRRDVLRETPALAHHVSDLRRAVLHALQRRAGYSEADARAGAEAAFAAFLQERHAVELYEEALAVIQSLHGRYRIGALTNGNADIYRTDAGDYFDFAFLAEEVGAGKPAPDLFEAAVVHAGVAAHEIAHVGDSLEHDVRGAKDAGLCCVWFNPNGEPLPEDCYPDAEIRCLTELPAALAGLDASRAGERD